MMMFSDVRELLDAVTETQGNDRPVTTFVLDSRKAIASAGAVFFAIAGERHDGHAFLRQLYERGFRQFIVERQGDYTNFHDATILRVGSSVDALQKIVAHHRALFRIPVIGITGSNGKTILKEWLYQLLSSDLQIVKNPGSYNSQTGVPLSVWQLDAQHQLGIFEAGISMPGEMEHLQKVIQPTIGIFTNVGTAHDDGFSDKASKVREKLKLFVSCDTLIYCQDHGAIAKEIEQRPGKTISWGSHPGSTLRVQKAGYDQYLIDWNGVETGFRFPFSDPASIENACHCLAVLWHLNYTPDEIQDRILKLRSIPMRLELKQGINGCQIIDDTYNNDLAGLQISLDFLTGIQHKKSVLIFSDILQSGQTPEALAKKIGDLILRANVSRLVGIGPVMQQQHKVFEAILPSIFFKDTADFVDHADLSQFHEDVILIKGARSFGFEKIVKLLVRKIHGTVMEIDLGAMVHNLNFFRSGLKENVRLMAMVKAFAYGSGSEEVAGLLQYHGIDYLGVAYPDEGAELRKNKIRLPVMVMNPSEESFELMITHNLEPEIYSLNLLRSFASFLSGRPWRIHLKIDTGMRRLGFEETEVTSLLELCRQNQNMEIASIFSHLAGADESSHDSFTHEQATQFIAIAERIKNELSIRPILHILNSSGILRFPEYQLDMVRLGIGLYGVNPTSEEARDLQPVATLKTVISQIKIIKRGETVGYGRKGKAENEMKIATLAIGYADGFSRSFSRGVGEVLIHGQRAPVVGNVCMDMTMVDITHISAKEGDEVIIFGNDLPIAELASKIQTIPYEILTGTSERVKRVFYAESI